MALQLSLQHSSHLQRGTLNVCLKRNMLALCQGIIEKNKTTHWAQITSETLYLPESHWLRGNSKVLWQVEPELIPVILLDVEVIADSRSSIILADCSKHACSLSRRPS